MAENTLFYCYLNLESTKTGDKRVEKGIGFYCYLNLESTKTKYLNTYCHSRFYCYLNLESTKTRGDVDAGDIGFTVT